MKRRLLIFVACCCLLVAAVCILGRRAEATITNYMSFQGKLTNPDGTNVTDGNYSIRFRIYTDPSADTGSCANTCKWEETQGTVGVGAGLFTINLGSGTALPGSVDFNSNTLYLGVKVGSDAEMTPRIRLTAAPQAFNSDLLDGLDSSALVQLSPGGPQAGNINVSGTITSGAVNGISIGSTLQPSSAGALTVQTNGANALNLDTGGGAAINIGGTNATSIVIGNASSNPSISFAGSGTFGTTTGAVSLNGNTTVTGTKTLSVSGGLTTLGAGLTLSAGVFGHTYSSGANSNAQTLSVTNSNSGGSSIAVTGHDITVVGTATSGGTNTNSAIKFENPSAAANNVFYGLNFAGTGFTDILRVGSSQIINGSGVLQSAGLSGTYSNALTLSNASNVLTASTYNGLTLTGAADGFTAAGGTTSRTLTVTGANITVGSTIQPTAAGALIVRSNGSNALTLTGGAASTWDIGASTLSVQTTNNGAITTGTGLLTVGGSQTFSGTTARTITGPATGGLTVTVGSGPLALTTTTSGALTITAAAASTWSTSAGGLTIQAAGTNTLTLNTGGAGTVDLGNTNTTTVNIGGSATALNMATGNVAHTLHIADGGTSTAQIVTLGSTNSGSTMTIQGSTISLLSGANITIGTADANATLLVLDSKSGVDPSVTNGGMYYNSTNSKFRCSQNSIWSDCINGFNTINKAADQAATQSSTTMQNDTALVFSVNANTNYVFDAWLIIDDSNATADVKYTFTTPAGATLNIMTDYFSTATANILCNITTSGTACANTTVNQAGLLVRVRGQVIVAGTSGNVQLQFAQNTSTAASFPVMKKGSVLTWHQSN